MISILLITQKWFPCISWCNRIDHATDFCNSDCLRRPFLRRLVWRDWTQTRAPALRARAAASSLSLLASASRTTSAARADPAVPMVW